MGKNYCQRLDKMRKRSKAVVAPSGDSVVENASPSVSLESFIGCPVPEPIICCQPKLELDPENSVKMECTNESCTFATIYLHQECFALYEDHLVKRLSTSGSARGWTDSQRRNNLWEKKGQALIGKLRRCRCGPGLVSLDKQALYEKEKNERKKKEKKEKNKKPPKVETSVKKQSEDRKRSHNRTRTFSNSSVSSYLTTPNTTATSSFNFRKDSERSEDSDVATQLVPAPLPPVQTRSYASTIKSETDLLAKHLHADETNQEDSGWYESPMTSPPELQNQFSPPLLTSTPRLINKSLEILRIQRKEKIVESMEMFEPLQYGWTPFSGMDFNLGERLMYFP